MLPGGGTSAFTCFNRRCQEWTPAEPMRSRPQSLHRPKSQLFPLFLLLRRNHRFRKLMQPRIRVQLGEGNCRQNDVELSNTLKKRALRSLSKRLSVTLHVIRSSQVKPLFGWTCCSRGTPWVRAAWTLEESPPQAGSPQVTTAPRSCGKL